MSSTMRGGGDWEGGAGGRDIVFSADPVGVGVSIGVASCLHSISLMNGWILAN